MPAARKTLEAQHWPRYRSPGQAQRFLSAHAHINNAFRCQHKRLSAQRYQHARTQAFSLWNEVAAGPTLDTPAANFGFVSRQLPVSASFFVDARQCRVPVDGRHKHMEKTVCPYANAPDIDMPTSSWCRRHQLCMMFRIHNTYRFE